MVSRFSLVKFSLWLVCRETRKKVQDVNIVMDIRIFSWTCGWWRKTDFPLRQFKHWIQPKCEHKNCAIILSYSTKSRNAHEFENGNWRCRRWLCRLVWADQWQERMNTDVFGGARKLKELSNDSSTQVTECCISIWWWSRVAESNEAKLNCWWVWTTWKYK